MKYITHNQWSGDHKFVEFYNRVISEDFDKIIIFCQNEWEWYNHEPEHWQLLQDYCKKINKTIHIVVGAAEKDFPVHIDNVDVSYWPTSWFGRTYINSMRMNKSLFIDPNVTVDYEHHFFNFNHRPKSHRCKVIDQLAKHDLFKHGAVSIHGTEVYSGTTHEGWEIFPWKHFKYKPMSLDTAEFTKDAHGQMFVVTDIHRKSFCQLVSETTDRSYFISEKTIMPLCAGKPFLVASRQGFHQLLKDMGFELYDEIFDYSFDSIVDEDRRYEMLVDNYKRLCEIPLNELPALTKQIHEKLLHNKNRVKEIVYERGNYPMLLQEVLKHYKTTKEEVDHLFCSLYEEEEMFAYHEW